MGDRANAAIQQDDQSRVYIYVHWCGEDLPELIRQALGTPQAKARWTDAPYLTRIVCDYVSSQIGSAETGMGISTSVQDYNWPNVLVIDPCAKVVYFEGIETKAVPQPVITFEDFIAGKQTWPDLDESDPDA